MKNSIIWLMLKYISFFYEILSLSFHVSLFFFLLFYSLRMLIFVTHIYAHIRNLSFTLKYIVSQCRSGTFCAQSILVHPTHDHTLLVSSEPWSLRFKDLKHLEAYLYSSIIWQAILYVLQLKKVDKIIISYMFLFAYIFVFSFY